MTTARPILMAAPMVRSTIEGRKTQTRRTVKLPPWSTGNDGDVEIDERGIPQIIDRTSGCFADIPLLYKTGDLFWVKETFAHVANFPPTVRYYATDDVHELRKRQPSIHMPRWASRLTLEITDVRVERLQDISEEDAILEGINVDLSLPNNVHRHWLDLGHDSKGAEWITGWDARDVYRQLWHSISGAGSWEANPWVWVLTFKVHHANVDSILAQRAEVAA